MILLIKSFSFFNQLLHLPCALSKFIMLFRQLQNFEVVARTLCRAICEPGCAAWRNSQNHICTAEGFERIHYAKSSPSAQGENAFCRFCACAAQGDVLSLSQRWWRGGVDWAVDARNRVRTWWRMHAYSPIKLRKVKQDGNDEKRFHARRVDCGRVWHGRA